MVPHASGKPVPVFSGGPSPNPGVATPIHDRVGGWSAGVPALVPSNFVNRTDRNARPGVDVHAETCWYHTDGDTPVFKGLAPSLAGDMRVVAAIVASMETELRRGLQNDENAYYYALMSHPGHHAGFSNAGGTAT